MGLLLDTQDERTVSLAARTLIGRSAHCGVVVADPRVSGEHAVVAWRGESWTVRDLSSRNGTLIEGSPAAPGLDHALRAGAVIQVGDRRLRLVDDGPPAPGATRLRDGARLAAVGGCLSLPDDDDPAVVIYAETGGAWVCEDDAGVSTVRDGDEIVAGGARYALHLPTSIDPTVGPPAPLELTLTVSADEEHTEGVVRCRGQVAALRPRGHLYLLVILARARLGPDGPRDGWLRREDLARMQRCDPVTINVQIHRLRQDLGLLPFDDAQSLLEIRPRTGLVRLGTDRVEVIRDG